MPKTKVERLPVELAQFIRLDYQDTTQESREIFNQIIFKLLELEEDKTYFIKQEHLVRSFNIIMQDVLNH